jgi:putative ABC transport system permease protein
VLVVSEVSLAVALLVGSALLIRTFIALYRVDWGFQARNVSLMRTSAAGQKYATSAGAAEAIRDGLARIRAIPGVLAAGIGCAPLECNLSLPFNIIG